MRTERDGYILAFALMIISLVTLFATQIFDKTLLFMPFSRVAVEREKAQLLAQGGVQIALQQLYAAVEPEEEKKVTRQQEDQQLLLNILPALNRWQVFKLKREVEGVKATVRVCISCEDGKIDLNSLYDFERKKFRDKKAANFLFELVEKKAGGTGLRGAFEKFLKERQNKIDDVTQLLALKAFAPFKDAVFYEPPTDKKEKRRVVYLTDIFTVWSERPMMEPWLLSDAIAHLFGLQRAQYGDIKKRRDAAEKWAAQFKSESKWPAGWNTVLSSVYDTPAEKVPKEVFPLLSTTFAPRTFAVLCSATVGSITQKLLAIIRRYGSSSDDEPKVKIIKQYWL